MLIGVLKEVTSGERRVALIPPSVSLLTGKKFEVAVEKGAGEAAGYPDDIYVERGATILPDRASVFEKADVVLAIHGPGSSREAAGMAMEHLRKGQVLIALNNPLAAASVMQEVAATGAMAFALELIPRITKAQSMDVLSSMATVAGYKAVLMAAGESPKMFPLLMTAAGTVRPARVFVIGAGVAGLQAIATSKRLGAVVHAYDIRPAVKEQVQSLGARFVELELKAETAEDKGGYARQMDEAFYERQREVMTKVVAESDVVISTAAVPGRKAPLLVTTAMIEEMSPGAVIVDLAAESGGNCELTKPGDCVEHRGVRIYGPVNVPSSIPFHASQMFSGNLTNLLIHLYKTGEGSLDFEDEITSQALVTRDGEVVNPRVKEMLNPAPAMASSAKEEA